MVRQKCCNLSSPRLKTLCISPSAVLSPQSLHRAHFFSASFTFFVTLTLPVLLGTLHTVYASCRQIPPFDSCHDVESICFMHQGPDFLYNSLFKRQINTEPIT
jgi:hypothetical protein